MRISEKQVRELIEENKLLRRVLEECPLCKCARYPFSEKERAKYKKCLKCEVLGKGIL